MDSEKVKVHYIRRGQLVEKLEHHAELCVCVCPRRMTQSTERLDGDVSRNMMSGKDGRRCLNGLRC